MTTDPSQHLGLLQTIIDRLNVPQHIRDEAYSEGLVALTRAASSFDERQPAVALSTWLWNSCRWSIQSWLRRQLKQMNVSLESAGIDFPVDGLGPSSELKETIEVAQIILTRHEYVAVVGQAWGLRHTEICAILRVTGTQVKSIREKGQEKMRETMRMI